jgi:hypothetical protein
MVSAPKWPVSMGQAARMLRDVPCEDLRATTLQEAVDQLDALAKRLGVEVYPDTMGQSLIITRGRKSIDRSQLGGDE